jgi:hypothetical protein
MYPSELTDIFVLGLRKAISDVLRNHGDVLHNHCDVLHHHGGVPLDTPVSELREIPSGKYGEDSQFIELYPAILILLGPRPHDRRFRGLMCD